MSSVAAKPCCSSNGQCTSCESKTDIAIDRAEWALILELLEAEQAELPGEIHHTDQFTMHEALLERKRKVGSLIERLRGATSDSPSPR